MLFLVLFVAITLIVLTFITISNILIFPRLKLVKDNLNNQSPFVSILIPARNEAHIIAETVKHLLAQTYPNFELIILDDNSTDDTATQIRNAARDDKRLKIIQGKALPDGWMGKSWACHQLSQMAEGEILIFTDADVKWMPDALSAIIQQMHSSNADLFTVWSTQETQSPAERLTVPLIAFAIFTYLPVIMTHYSPFPAFAAANGQCMAWKREAYQKIDGHNSVANSVLDDVKMAQHAKAQGLRVRMADGNQLIQCRMYQDWASVRDGFAKNILAGYGNSLIALSLSIIFHLLVFIAPIFWLIFAPDFRAWAGIFILQAILLRALSASFTHQRILDAIFMPLSVLLMTLISIQSILWHITGRASWKGRTISAQAMQKRRSHG